MNAVVKTCGACYHSTPSTVENMTGFTWCTKRQMVGRNMEAVFLNPNWQRECGSFSSTVITGVPATTSSVSKNDALLPSTGSLTASIAMEIPPVNVPVPVPQSSRQMAKQAQTPDLFAGLFM